MKNINIQPKKNPGHSECEKKIFSVTVLCQQVQCVWSAHSSNHSTQSVNTIARVSWRLGTPLDRLQFPNGKEMSSLLLLFQLKDWVQQACLEVLKLSLQSTYRSFCVHLSFEIMYGKIGNVWLHSILDILLDLTNIHMLRLPYLQLAVQYGTHYLFSFPALWILGPLAIKIIDT
jgi:hypothetical protein